ncbi:MAG: electron transfer flavoprotein subunit alpha/FixB family protein [Deltaproteobacteria bacterium]|nr:electron transfer flavoprotein subunit alpha/FixB family protein [Deltaproteobacteria bacterium]
MTNILIVAEHQGGVLKKTALELATKASSLGGEVEVVLIGSNLTKIDKELGAYGVKKVFLLSNTNFERYNTEGFTKVLVELIQERKSGIVLGSASPLGLDLFPRLAARLKVGLATDCTELRIDGGQLVATRPVYAGKAFVDVTFSSTPQMATIRPNSFATKQTVVGSQAELIKKQVDPGPLRATIKEIRKGKSEKPDLTEAEIIVSGGRAMGSAETFKILHELADTIGATVGASRAAVDSGYATHDMQVGQTGKTVNPKLYIACGISGAIQHLAGMRTAKVIVAINKDPEAPLFSKADYGIVDDLFKVVPALTAEFKKVLSET